MRETILTDVDGILVDFSNEYLRLLELLYGVRKTEADITDFDFRKCVSTTYQDVGIWDYISRHSGFVYNLPTYVGAMGFLAELRALGRVVACTTPAGPYWTAERSQWLLREAGFDKKDIVVAGDKSIIHGDYLIDDAEHNCKAWSNGAGKGGFALLMDRPWNESANPSSYWKRCEDYQDIIDTIKELREP